MEYEFEIQEPEEELEYVSTPQILIANTKNNQVRATIYFMANTALQIKSGIANSAMGKIRLQYVAETPSSVYTASETLRKIVFIFNNSNSMVKNFEFHGQKT